MNEILSQIGLKLYEGDAPGVAALARRALELGVGADDILRLGLLPGMERVGRDFRDGELFIPEVIVAARAMHAGIAQVQPLLGASGAAPAGTIVLGTVQGDLHDIGKKLVGIMMQGAGFAVIDLGHDVAPERFVEAVLAHRPELVGLSALLSTTMPVMGKTVEALRKGAARVPVKVLVGGAPLTQAFADESGADGWAPDAVGAVERARAMLTGEGRG